MGKEMEPGVEGLLSKQSPGPPASLVGSTQHPKKCFTNFSKELKKRGCF